MLILLLLLKLHEKLLGVASDLGACARPDMLLNQSPVFVVQSQAFEKALVLCLRPSTVLRHFVGLRESIHREEASRLLLEGRLASQVWHRHSIRLPKHYFLRRQDERILFSESVRVDMGDTVSIHAAHVGFIIGGFSLFVRRRV